MTVEFARDSAGGVEWVVVQRLLAPADVVADHLVATEPGHRVVTEDPALVAALVARGGRVQRKAHDYTYDLTSVPPDWAGWPVPQGFQVTYDLDPAGLVAAHVAANPPGHPDHELTLDHLRDLTGMVEGKIIGPLVPAASMQVVDADGPCGAVLVVDRSHGRVWVVDVFVHPRHHGRGLGGALLRRSVSGAARAGYAEYAFVVTDGNPARQAYDAIGFRHVRGATNVDLP